MKPWEIFLEKYRDFGQRPSRETHARLFAPDAAVFHPGMAGPMPAAQYVDFIVEGLKRLPEFHLIPVHWAVNGDTLFVEARNTATVKNRPVVWPATYVVTLRDEMVIRGRAYYDRTEVLCHFEPTLAAAANAHAGVLEEAAPHGSSASDSESYPAQVYQRIVVPYAENWKHVDPHKFREFYADDARMINPGFERPLRPDELAGYYSGLIATIPGLRLSLEQWAAAPALLFTEWTVNGEVAGRRLEFGNTDRMTLRDARVVEGIAYFDNLTVRAAAEPALARFGNVSFANLPTGPGQGQ